MAEPADSGASPCKAIEADAVWMARSIRNSNMDCTRFQIYTINQYTVHHPVYARWWRIVSVCQHYQVAPHDTRFAHGQGINDVGKRFVGSAVVRVSQGMASRSTTAPSSSAKG